MEMMIKCFALPHFWECKIVQIFSTDGPGQYQGVGGEAGETVGSGKNCVGWRTQAPSSTLVYFPLVQKVVEIWVLCETAIYCW